MSKFNPKRLSLARKRRRLTGKGLAAAAGLSAVTVSRLENGDNEPDEVNGGAPRTGTEISG